MPKFVLPSEGFVHLYKLCDSPLSAKSRTKCLLNANRARYLLRSRSSKTEYHVSEVRKIVLDMEYTFDKKLDLRQVS